MTRALPLESPYHGCCPDCPASRQGVLETLVHGGRGACLFPCVSVAARATLPTRWAESYAFVLVRRGVLVRQRMDARGRVSAVDAAGAGCLLPLARERDDRSASATGYAATDALVCLLPQTAYDDVVRRGGEEAREVLDLHRLAMERVERLAHARAQGEAISAVATMVLTLADTLTPPKPRDRIPSGLQQRDIAALLGLRHETVCRALTQLEGQGALERDPEGIRIVDRGALEGA